MERPIKVKRCVGSKTATQILQPLILPVILLFLLMDMASSARPVQSPSGVHSSYHLRGSVMDVAEKTFDVGSNLDEVPVLQSDIPHDARCIKRVGQRVLSCADVCTGDYCFSPDAPGGTGCGGQP